MQTILGSGGAIGTELAKTLRSYDQHIRLVSRTPQPVDPSDELFVADLCNAEDTEKAVAGSSVVYLCVGLKYDIKVWREKWPIIMQNTINACLKHKAILVFVDNVYMYAVSALKHMTENATTNPISKKGQVRQGIIKMLFDAINEKNLQACVARSADFYGPGIKNSILLELVYNNLKNDKTALWQQSKNKIHSFTYTPDAAKAIALLGNNPKALGQIWHLPTAKEKLTGQEWINLLASHLHKKPKLLVLPEWLLKIMGIFSPLMKELEEMSYQYKYDYYFDSSKFEEAFEFIPTPVNKAIEEIVNNP
ncbi:NAD-dependent epimerase/dehydratase family protein [Olivibacter domesticus]|uniref:Nucleoside-diphosphate-sugar epimerase n=1 Tax=Olivibacter domesticus TaxID=407022 RepID=A0A1H7ZVS1_OLID1|nr:NAD-dependent epimerase/dehydratase family protein [Olivibacter domesticus]SEM61844.1 Nucleoside-diphosphate-sugar epimerase [Olivibacter domesticus]